MLGRQRPRTGATRFRRPLEVSARHDLRAARAPPSSWTSATSTRLTPSSASRAVPWKRLSLRALTLAARPTILEVGRSLDGGDAVGGVVNVASSPATVVKSDCATTRKWNVVL